MKEGEKTSDSPAGNKQKEGENKAEQTKCEGCGYRNHLKQDCWLKSHPGFNKTEESWNKSTNGKAYAAQKPSSSVLQKNKKPDGTKFNYKKPQKGESSDLIQVSDTVIINQFAYLNQATKFEFIKHPDHSVRLLTCHINFNDRQIELKALIDTGAQNSSFISNNLASNLDELGIKGSPANQRVCGGLSNACVVCAMQYTFDITYKPDIFDNVNLNKSIHLENVLAIDTPFDIIIGMPDIQKYKLIESIPSFLGGSDANCIQTAIERMHESASKRNEPGSSSIDCNNGGETNTILDGPPTQSEIVHRKDLIDSVESNEDGIHSYCPWDCTEQEEYTSETRERYKELEQDHPSMPFITTSNPEFRQNIQALCMSYPDVFKERLSTQPANIAPLTLKVDETKWHSNKTARHPRVQSGEMEKITGEHIKNMLEMNLIQTSQARTYSQVLLTPKPGSNKWRFCVDYRILNDATESLGWPIPNIKGMLMRLGRHKSKYFGILDLSSGYYQAPLAEESRPLTAFITFMGIYEWLRVPMGLKSAGSYFQQLLATIVLAGLIYFICELYIDDILVHARTEAEFLIRLEKILERCRMYNIALNPGKCKLGIEEIEYVGHKIDRNGISFTREKLDGVMDFEKPIFSKQLKQFLGLANYFKDNIRRYSQIMYPLNQLLRGYKKGERSRIQWSEEATSAYIEIKTAINNCPTLFFLDPKADVFLHTDASDYGIGGYLWQQIAGREQPVAFISKSLSGPQKRWDTPQKEAYAIFYSITQLDHLLRDIHFTVKTDHKNLVYINETASPMVVRWKIAIQGYDFHILHIPGKDNLVADGFSRLVPNVLASLVVVEPEEQEMYFCPMVIESESRIPDSVRMILKRVHNSTTGHHGVERTMQKVATICEEENKPMIENLRKHVDEFIKKCPCCQKMNFLKVPVHTKHFTVASYEPHQRLNIDTMGPFEQDEKGYKYILVVIDMFTRWVEVFALKTVESEECAEKLFEHFGRYGAPLEILTDNGTQFVNKRIAELMKLIQVDHRKTIAYSKQENGIVERCNKELMRHIRALVYEKKTPEKWSSFLPMVQRIINATKHGSTNAKPADLLFGGAINLDRSILISQTETVRTDIELSKWASDMLVRQQVMLRQAQETQMQKDERHTNKAQPPETNFEIGSYVLVEYRGGLRKGPPNKMLTNLKGPFQVLGKSGAQYTVRNLQSNKDETYHASAMQPFIYEPMDTDPADVAIRDQQEFVVEQIVQHRGSQRIRSTMEFLVKWRGFGSEHDSWEPYQNLRLVDKLHDYLRLHKMASLIPKKLETV